MNCKFLKDLIVKTLKDRKTKAYKVFMLIIIIVLIFTFYKLAAYTDNPIYAAFFVVLVCITYNRYIPQNKKLTSEAIILITLTFVMLQTTYPIFQPRVEVISVDEPSIGKVINETPYGSQEYTLTITPSIIPSCKRIKLGYDLQNMYNVDYRYGIDTFIYENGEIGFCTYFFDFTKRVGKYKVLSLQYINFGISNKNITMLPAGGSTHVTSTTFSNREDFPIHILRNVTYSITNTSTSEVENELWNFLMDDTSKMECRLKNIKFSYTDDYNSGIEGTYINESDKINLIFDIAVYVPPHNRTFAYIHFDPYACDTKRAYN